MCVPLLEHFLNSFFSLYSEVNNFILAEEFFETLFLPQVKAASRRQLKGKQFSKVVEKMVLFAVWWC